MKFLNNYQMFIEALLPSQFRRYMKFFDRERYEAIFKKYDGDKKHYRIFLPLIAEPTFLKNDDDDDNNDNDSIKDEIEGFLDDNGYDMLDYIKGICKGKNARNPSKIGQVLTRLERTNDEAKELMKKFVEDPIRKVGDIEELIAVVSRHPYDIAGADTDRAWTNCMTIAHAGSPKVEEMREKLLKLIDKQKKLSVEATQSELKADEIEHAEETMDEDEFQEFCDKLGYTEDERDELKDRSKQMQEEEEKIRNQIENLQETIDDRLSTGENAKYLLYDVKEGSLIAFLIKKSDKNIQNPLCTINIKPYISEEDKEDFILVSDSNMYGQNVPEFKKTVDKWLDEVNGPGKEGYFCLNKKLYNDQGADRIQRMPKGKLIKMLIDNENYSDILIRLKSGQIDDDDLKMILSKVDNSVKMQIYTNYNAYLSVDSRNSTLKMILDSLPEESRDELKFLANLREIRAYAGGGKFVELFKSHPDYIKYFEYGGIFKTYNDDIFLSKIFDDDNLDTEVWEGLDSEYGFAARNKIFNQTWDDGIFVVEVDKEQAKKLKKLGFKMYDESVKISKPKGEKDKKKKDKKIKNFKSYWGEEDEEGQPIPHE